MEKQSQSPGFAKLELKIMQALWELGDASVSAVQQKMDPPLAYTTVQTMLNRLEAKGKVRRELQGRAYLYRAAVTQARATGQGVRDLIDRMFGGSSEELVMSLLKTRQIDAKMLAELTKRFHQEAAEGGSDHDPS
jgi:predicted transcriptional regulator